MVKWRLAVYAILGCAALWGALSPCAHAMRGITSLKVAPGPQTGAVEISWVWPDDFQEPFTYAVQYSTQPRVAWHWKGAQITEHSEAVTLGSPQLEIVGGLDCGKDGAGNDISPVYYFKVWIIPGPSQKPIPSNRALSRARMPEAPIPAHAVTVWSSTTDVVGQTYDAGECVTSRGTDFFVRKRAPDGVEQWTKYYNGPANGNDTARSVALNDLGHPVAVGAQDESHWARGVKLVLRTYDADGNLVFGRAFRRPQARDCRGETVSIGADGTIVVDGVETPQSGAQDSVPMTYRFSALGEILDSLPRERPAFP